MLVIVVVCCSQVKQHHDVYALSERIDLATILCFSKNLLNAIQKTNRLFHNITPL